MDYQEVSKDEILMMVGRIDACTDMGIKYISISCETLVLVLQDLLAYKMSDEIIKKKQSNVNESHLN
jgi:hypothetical protein